MLELKRVSEHSFLIIFQARGKLNAKQLTSNDLDFRANFLAETGLPVRSYYNPCIMIIIAYLQDFLKEFLTVFLQERENNVCLMPF